MEQSVLMEQSVIDGLIGEAAREVAERYVFPDVGDRIAAGLRERAASGRYKRNIDERELAVLVTEDLQAVNGDRHLRLLHHEEPVPDLPSDEMMLAMMIAQAARGLNGIARVERLGSAALEGAALEGAALEGARIDGAVALLEIDLLYPPVIAGAAQTAAMQVVASASALILDLRRCLGGDPDAVALLCGYLFDEPVHLNDIYAREGGTTTQSWSPSFVPGDRFGGTKPVYVLTSGTTFSGGEELAYDLQQLGRATIVGESTGGVRIPASGSGCTRIWS